MKRIAFILCTMFICVDAWPETTDLKFVIDNETYATQTCTVGGAVNLPPTPTKYGYDFDGWAPVFYRGTFATWNNIPTNTGDYLGDTNGSNIPRENDYIIVNNASDVPEYKDEEIEIRITNITRSFSDWATPYGASCYVYINKNLYSDCISQTTPRITIENSIYTDMHNIWSYGTRWATNVDTVVNFLGKKYQPGQFFLVLAKQTNSNGTYYTRIVNNYPYSGKWLLRYHGNWDDYNRGGWIAEKQLD